MSALDDPIVPVESTANVVAAARDNSAIKTHITERGGHVGWVEGAIWSRDYYMEETVVSFLAS
jgi:predicted alpha/beta-fold hydrolase